ncbi:uncharacterized protein LOC133178326 [Saccostrea echinata]|uniref:uncharacterized protein LOC133178326 n=1 Tax=Saccostrea echinata TaxID=191078 RepID=UPI002A80F301|nr:uncharacterized protein LOC133178326 [Saccostrea echinata]
MEMSGEDFVCSVCGDKFSCTRILPCFHTFCEKCIDALLCKNDEKERNSQYLLECPVCGDEVLAPNTNISAKEWVRSLPRNFLLESLMNSERSGGKCDPCLRATEEKEATYHCQNCKENLCEMCYSYMHQRIEGFQEHVILTHTFGEDKRGSTSSCVLHTSEILEAYCTSHKLLCCKICMATDHRDCSEVKPIESIAKQITNEEPKDVMSKVLPVLEKTDSALIPINKAVECHEMKYVDFCNSVSSIVDNIKKNLEEMQDVFNEKLQETQRREVKYLASAEKHLEAFLKTLAEAEKLLTIVAMRGTRRQMFVTVLKVKFQIQKQIERLEKQYGKQFVFDCHLNTELEEFNEIEYIAQLDEDDAETVGIAEISEALETFEGIFQFDNMAPEPETVVDPSKLEAKEIAKYDEGLTRHCVECVPLSSGAVLLLELERIRVLSDGNMCTVYELPKTDNFQLKNICLDDEEKRVFVFTSDKKIITFTLHDMKLQRVEHFQTNIETAGFRFFSNKFYCRLHNSDEGIAVLDEDGKLLRFLHGPVDGRDIALSKDGQRIYFDNHQSIFWQDVAGGQIVDRGESKDHCYSQSFCGLDVDLYGNVYVCETLRGQILQVPRGEKTASKVILDRDPDFEPLFLRFDRERKRFCVFFTPSYYSDERLVKVFDLFITDDEIEETSDTE